MKRSIFSKMIVVLTIVLLCTACGKDTAVQTLETTIAATAEEAAALEDVLENEPLNQMELNETAGAIYTIWDDALNATWALLQEELDDEALSQLEKEQTDWIAEKEAAVESAGAEVEGGSMYPMVVSLKAAELTEERVYELAEYLQ